MENYYFYSNTHDFPFYIYQKISNNIFSIQQSTYMHETKIDIANCIRHHRIFLLIT